MVYYIESLGHPTQWELVRNISCLLLGRLLDVCTLHCIQMIEVHVANCSFEPVHILNQITISHEGSTLIPGMCDLRGAL